MKFQILKFEISIFANNILISNFTPEYQHHVMTHFPLITPLIFFNVSARSGCAAKILIRCNVISAEFLLAYWWNWSFAVLMNLKNEFEDFSESFGPILSGAVFVIIEIAFVKRPYKFVVFKCFTRKRHKSVRALPV